MATIDDSQTEIYLNFYNGGAQPKLVYVANSISPSPSAQSENSVECAKDATQHDHDQDSSTGTCGDDEDPYDSVDVVDDSTQELTNLTWLTQLKSLVQWPNSVNPILDDDYLDGSSEVGENGGAGGARTTARGGVGITPISKKDTLNDRFQRFVGQARQNRESYNKSAELYQMDTTDKPPFNYAQMIAMAMLENGRMTLQHIYSWIQNKFGYYRVRNNWNNSIRHNLSLQFCFRKIERNVYNKGDGKGGYWELGIDVNKSERKRIRNRSGIAGQKAKPRLSTDSSPDIVDSDHTKRRRRCCQNSNNPPTNDDDLHHNFANQQDIDLIVDDLAGSSEDNNYLFNRTLNSINAPIGIDHALPADDLDIGSIIEVDQQIGQGAGHDAIGHATNEYHVLGDITHGDYLNISTLDLMSSAEDMFDGSDFSGAGAGNHSATGETDVTVPTLIAAMVNSQCGGGGGGGIIGGEIFLASEVPQPGENVIISALHPYETDPSQAFHANHITTANVIIESGSMAMNTNDGNDAVKANNDTDILMKAFSFDGIGHEFQLLTNCNGVQDVTNRDELIEVLYDIQTHNGRDF